MALRPITDVITGTGPFTYTIQRSCGGGAFADFDGPFTATTPGAVSYQVETDGSEDCEFRFCATNECGGPVYGNPWLVDCVNDNCTTAPALTGPTDVTIIEGDVALFSVSATGGGPYTYVWEESTDGGATWSTLTATGSSYVYDPLVTADGNLYRVTVTNDCGTTTSQTALLTVESAAQCPPRTWVGDTLLQHPEAPTTTDVINVTTGAEMLAALQSIDNGAQNDVTIRLTSNITVGQQQIDGLVGTAAAPIVIDGNGFTMTATQSRPLYIYNSSYVYVQDLTIDGGSGPGTWGLGFGGLFNGQTNVGPCDHIYVYGCTIHSTQQVGIKFRSTDVFEAVGNNIYNTGMSTTSDSGEGIYIGEGALLSAASASHNGLIENNWIHDTSTIDDGGEAIDVKNPSTNITIRRNLIENIVVKSQGAITLNTNQNSSPSNAGHLVELNYIRNVVTTTSDGDGITVGAGNVIVRNNIIHDVDNHGIGYTDTSGGPSDTVTIENNTIVRTGDDAIGFAGSAGEPGGAPVTIVACGNATDDTTGQVQVANTDFVGPTTTEQGFEPVAGSAVIDNGGCTATDYSEIGVQDGSRDAGAIEFCDGETSGGCTAAPTLSGPDSAAVAAGQFHTFTVSAAGGGPYTYVWQRMDVGGTWFTISSTINSHTENVGNTASDDGAKFRVLVTNPCGTTTSQEATLTVL